MAVWDDHDRYIDYVNEKKGVVVTGCKWAQSGLFGTRTWLGRAGRTRGGWGGEGRWEGDEK